MATQIVIEITETGALKVNTNPPGLLMDKVAIFGLLEVAKDAIKTHHKNSESRIIPAAGPLPAPGSPFAPKS